MLKKTLSDAIIEEILNNKIDTAFVVTGGGSMHLNNSIGKSNLKTFYLHNEQSCSMAADAYARITKKPALVCVTTGPGGINALNGVFGAYTDSIPMLIVSGQVKRQTLNNQKRGLRQLGDQENDIVYMSSKITKKSLILKSKKNYKKIINNLIKLATENRPGPVWIDIPIDIQGKVI